MSYFEDNLAKILEIATVNFDSANVNMVNLNKFHKYLSNSLQFPFNATYEDEQRYGTKKASVQLTKLLQVDASGDPLMYGLMVEGISKEGMIQIPLAISGAEDGSTESHLIEFYRDWFWNYR